MADWKIRNNYNTMIIGPVTPDDLVLNPVTDALYLIDEELAPIVYQATQNGIQVIAHYKIDLPDEYIENYYFVGYLSHFERSNGGVTVSFLSVFNGDIFHMIPEKFWE